MKWRDYMPRDVRLALEHFHENQAVPMADREVIAGALRHYLTSLGYLDTAEAAQPSDEINDETETEASA